MQNKILNSISGFFKRKSFGLSALLPDFALRNQSWNGQPLDAYYIDLYVNKALDKRGEKVGQSEFIITKNSEEIDNHPFLKVLNKPNPNFDGPVFWKMYQIIKDIYGESYIWIEASRPEVFAPKNVQALHLLNPRGMRVLKRDESGRVIEYEYQTSVKTTRYPAEEIIRSFKPDPGNIGSLKGMSLLEAGKNSIHTNIQLAQHQANIIKNGGKVEGVFKFKTDGRLTKDQLRELKKGYKEEYSEAGRAGLPLFMGGDADYIRTGLTPAELAYLESKKVTLEDICILTEVPKAVLSSVDDIKYSNAETVYRIFLSETIEPLVNDRDRVLTNKLLAGQEGMAISHRNMVPENREEKRKDLETADKICALTINEKRNELGYDPVPGGDKILIPFSLIELGKKEEPAQPADQKKKDNGGDYDHPLKDFYIRRKYFEYKIKKLDKREAEMQGMMKTYFNGQAERMAEKIKSCQSPKRKDLIDDRFDIENEIKIITNKYLPLAEKFLIESGQESLNFINYPYKFLMNGEIRGWLEGKASIFGRQINETTFKKLKDEFAESLASGEGRAQLVERILNTYDDITVSRAATIARTEVLGVTQRGTFDAYKQAMIPIKIWSAILDTRTRDSHAIIDGEERPINVPFSNGLMHPGDSRGSAEEVINCRCVI